MVQLIDKQDLMSSGSRYPENQGDIIFEDKEAELL